MTYIWLDNALLFAQITKVTKKGNSPIKTYLIHIHRKQFYVTRFCEMDSNYGQFDCFLFCVYYIIPIN